MKPANWDRMTDEEKMEYGRDLLKSGRGHYLLAQALVIASDAMKRVPLKRREVSNVEDMEVLQLTVFRPMVEVLRMGAWK